jgi:hypothetical protein
LRTTAILSNTEAFFSLSASVSAAQHSQRMLIGCSPGTIVLMKRNNRQMSDGPSSVAEDSGHMRPLLGVRGRAEFSACKAKPQALKCTAQ